jgi:ABC-2 type transport system ATP-binding protein
MTILIEAKNLTKSFKGRTVLDKINFTVTEGEIFGYLGPNGAGKTTTIRLILGLLRPTSGEALVWGNPLGDSPALRKRVGVVLETDGLYERLSARDNLTYFALLYGVRDYVQKIDRILSSVGLHDRQHDNVGTFSKGMRRKLALARAIVAEPGILFLDEPAAGLDPEAQHLVRELILDLAREYGLAVFLNSHDLDEVERICQTVAILHNGRLEAYDRVENLRRSTESTVELTLADRDETGRAAELLTAQPFVSQVTARPPVLRVSLGEAGQSPELLSLLVKNGIAVEEARRLNRSLEDVYLDVIKGSR